MAKEDEELKKAEQPEGGAPEIPPLSGRDRYRNRYKKANPDLDLDDEEAFYSAANANLDELDGYRKNNGALVKAMGKNKALGAMLSAAKDGTDPFLWLSENLGTDLSELISNPEYAQKVSEAAQRYQQAQEDGEASRKQTEENWRETFQNLKNAQEELGLTDDEAYELASEVLTILTDAGKGIVSVETFKKLRDGGRYDSDIKSAREEGTIAGKNARIHEDLRKENPAGVPPSLPSGGGEAPKREQKKKSFFSDVE